MASSRLLVALLHISLIDLLLNPCLAKHSLQILRSHTKLSQAKILQLRGDLDPRTPILTFIKS